MRFPHRGHPEKILQRQPRGRGGHVEGPGRMIRHLSALTAFARNMFLLPPAPAWTIYSGILFVIPAAIVLQYRSLYLVSLGLSDTEVGMYSFAFIPLGVVCLWIAGYLTDTWGRKMTLFLFDAVSWSGYCLLLALA